MSTVKHPSKNFPEPFFYRQNMYFLAAKTCLILDRNQKLNHHMINQLNLLMILVLQSMFFNVKAQSPSSSQNNKSSPDHVSQFQSSLAAVIGLLTIMFCLTFILVLYGKFCHRAASVDGSRVRIQDDLPRSRSRFSGIDKSVVESLPFFRFSSLRGSRRGLECAVCLSKFEDIEILRLLPKCKHAFHINCIDLWLEKHSSCPLCRQKVNADDLSLLRDSTSLRFLWNQSALRGESSLELHIEREEDYRGASRFSIGRSFRRFDEGKNDEELPIQQNTDTDENDERVFHKFNHKIIMPGVVFKNRWSNLSSSDLLFLSSEMLSDETSSRFASVGASKERPSGSKAMNHGEITNIKEDIERKRVFESKFSKIKQNDSFSSPVLHKASESTEISSSSSSKILNPTEKRSMSEITVHPRFAEFDRQNSGRESSSLPENTMREEKMRRIWLPIARKTIEWFTSRERSSFHAERQSSNVKGA